MRVRGSGLMTGTGWYRIYDYHLFYESIRGNAVARAAAFLARAPTDGR